MAKDFFRQQEIQLALVTGLCIIVLSFLVKSVFHAEAGIIKANAPAFVYIFYIFLKDKSKGATVHWALAMIIITVAIILTYVF